MANLIGIEDARKTLGDLADLAHHEGRTTYLTRHGRPVAAIVPLDRIDEQAPATGSATWDPQTRELTIRSNSVEPTQVIRIDQTEAARYRLLHPAHALALAGWSTAGGSVPLHAPGDTEIVRYPTPDGQAEQLAAWSARYGQYQAVLRGTAAGRLRLLVVTDPDTMILEGDALVLETADPNNTLFQRASTAMGREHQIASAEDRAARHTVAALIAGVGL